LPPPYLWVSENDIWRSDKCEEARVAESGEEKRINDRPHEREERGAPSKDGRSVTVLSRDQVLKGVLSLVLVAFAITRFFYYETLGARIDLVLFSLVLSVFLLWIIPWKELWERLRELSVGGVGISLVQSNNVQAAIGSISIEQENLKISGSSFPEEVRDKLRRRLKSLEGELQTIRGSRVLWIDDRPDTILGERRLLRAFGIDVTSATSSERAEEILKEDNDFDLLITDVQRSGTSYKFVDKGTEIHEGVNFVVKLRKEETDERIKSLPIIFYAAYSWESLVDFTRLARELRPPEPEISNSVDDLIPKVIRSLSEERIDPITVSAKKTPTGTRLRR